MRSAWTVTTGAVLALVLTACTTQVFGSARPGEPPNRPAATAAAPPPGPPQVPAESARGMLLSIADLERLTGDTGMSDTGTFTEEMSGSFVQPYECAATSLVTLTGPVSERTGMVGGGVRGAGGWTVMQLVVTFPPNVAEFLHGTAIESGETLWAKCPEGEPFTIFTPGNKVLHYTRGPIERTRTRIGVTLSGQQAPPRTCRHVLGYQANVIADTVVCSNGGDPTGAANGVIDALLAKVPGS